VARNGKRFGPYTKLAARNYLAQGSIRTEDLCWEPGMNTWLPASKALEVQPVTETAPLHNNADRVGETRRSTSPELNPKPRQAKIPSWDELLMRIARRGWGYDDLTDAEKKALLSTRKYAEHPQPIDYGLTRYDLFDDSEWRNGSPRDDGFRYKEGKQWLRVVLWWKPRVETLAGFGILALIIGAFSLLGLRESLQRGGIPPQLIILGSGLLCVLPATLISALIRHQRKHPAAGVAAYQEDHRRHHLYEIAVHEAEQELQKLKRSYWEGLNGYQFESATAEVLKKHHFNTAVTRGSGDGGVDINAARSGLSGVVQCKAHAASVGPHVVRDLWGVIHHLRADFGIIVSRGGFTRGAIDFARDKPIYFLDTDDLIAMQEGRDVLAKAFTRTSA
jgi:restriction system protein